MRQLINVSYAAQVERIKSDKEFAAFERKLEMPPEGERFAARNRRSRVTQQLTDMMAGGRR